MTNADRYPHPVWRNFRFVGTGSFEVGADLSLRPATGRKMSQYSLAAGYIGGLLARFADLKRKARQPTGSGYPIIPIHEASLDGFWVHRVLQDEGIESHVVDAAPIARSRRRRRAKTDKIDGEALLEALLAFKRGEPRVCSMVVAPSPEEVLTHTISM